MLYPALPKAGRRRLNMQAHFQQGSSFELVQELVMYVSGAFGDCCPCNQFIISQLNEWLLKVTTSICVF